jgi:hypothetical protein
MLELSSAGPFGADVGDLLVTGGWLLLVYIIYTCVISPIATGAMTVAVSERFLGRPASIGSAYRRVVRHILPLCGSMALLTAPLVLGMVVAVFGSVLAAVLLFLAWHADLSEAAAFTRLTAVAMPFVFGSAGGLWLLFMTVFGFVPAAVVLEERGLGGILRSWQLVKGSFWRVLGLVLVLLLMVVMMGVYVRLPSQILAGMAGLSGELHATVLGSLAMQLGITLVDPMRMVGVTLTYYDLRIRKEGFDLALLAGELGGGQPPERPTP